MTGHHHLQQRSVSEQRRSTKFSKLRLTNQSAETTEPVLLAGRQRRSRMVASSSEFRTLFAAFDRDADGKISAAELRLCMKAALSEDISAEDAEALVASADTDGDGLLDEEEFLTLVQAEVEEEERYRGLKEAFGMYEMEGEGCITPTSLKRMLGRLGSEQDIDDCRTMICRFDLNGDGVLSFDEFKIMMNA